MSEKRGRFIATTHPACIPLLKDSIEVGNNAAVLFMRKDLVAWRRNFIELKRRLSCCHLKKGCNRLDASVRGLDVMLIVLWREW